MGEGSQTVYIHKGVSYVVYRSHDGYLDRIGADVVNQVPVDSADFEVWLKTKKDFFDAEEQRIMALEQKYLEEDPHGESKISYAPYQEKPSRTPGLSEIYVYTINLDELTFAVNTVVASFPLRNIPRGEDGKGWIQYLEKDGHGFRILKPNTPKEYCQPPLSKNRAISEEGLARYSTFAQDVRIIDESAWMPRTNDQTLSTSRVLASAIVRGLMMFHNHKLRKERILPPDSELFHIKAEALLRAASPAGFFLSNALPNDYWNYIHHSGHRSGMFYRYRGCVIFLTGDCSTTEHLNANVGLAVSHAQETGTDSCTVIIFSIQHVAVAVISGAVSGKLQISHSNIQSVLDAFGTRKEDLEKGLGLIAHYLRPHGLDGAMSRLNARQNDLLDSNRLSLPFDVLLHIMKFVGSKNYNVFCFVSRDLRKEWIRHPRIANYTVRSIQSIDNQEYDYLPICTVNAARRNGSLTSLRLFYRSRCGLYNDDTYHGPREPCCPCQTLCYGKKCQQRVGLRMSPQIVGEHEKPENFFGAARPLYIGRDAMQFFEAMFLPGLRILDPERSCKNCTQAFGNAVVAETRT